jgi:hypothetical protein
VALRARKDAKVLEAADIQQTEAADDGLVLS